MVENGNKKTRAGCFTIDDFRAQGIGQNDMMFLMMIHVRVFFHMSSCAYSDDQ
jgi:hypothetical protein